MCDPFKKIPLVIEGNNDSFNIFEVGESTFNGGGVKNMGGNSIDPCTREEWLTCNAKIVEKISV